MDRITRKDLERSVTALNTRTGFAGQEVWNTALGPELNPDGSLRRHNVATVGMFYVDGAYGGWSLYQVVSESGGVRDVFRCGHTTARDLYNRVTAYITALEDVESGVKQ